MTEFYGCTYEDLFDFNTIEKLQVIFSSLTGMEAVVCSLDGIPLIYDERYREQENPYCTDFIRSCELGMKLCHLCVKENTKLTAKVGNSTVSYCHGGLLLLTEPITLRGEIIATFRCDGIRTRAFSYDEISRTAEFFGFDVIGLWEAAAKIRIMPDERVRLASEELHVLAGVLSDMAESSLKNRESEESLKRANTVKSDFLANMSHEIRTPMNAVIGMSDLALREDMPDKVREYINLIKSAGKALLTIINDILDYSKVESGKIEILAENYEPMSIINDIISIITTRIGDKPIELLLDVSPDIPKELIGDGLRLSQVLINLTNNAVKFTEKGYICLHVRCEMNEDKSVAELVISVEDTGIGIKQQELSKLFQSFSQADSKRNRNIEGTGLGLAIVRRLLDLMGGSVTVESQYNVGSTFTVRLPQNVADPVPFIDLEDAGKYVFTVLCDYKPLSDSIAGNLEMLHIECRQQDQNTPLKESLMSLSKERADKEKYFLVEEKIFEDRKSEFIEAADSFPDIRFCVMTAMTADTRKWNDMEYITVIRKPVYGLSVFAMLHHQDIDYGRNSDEEIVDFEAPDAKVLIVDDNSVNLTVASGLLEPLHMHVDTAISGTQCLEMIEKTLYDMILMDHMMPGMDGVETTHIIRRMYPRYAKVPIIALTANAVREAREMFLKEGLDDFIPKPVEPKTLIAKVKQWLDPSKIITLSKEEAAKKNAEANAGMPDLDTLTLADIDVRHAKNALGDKVYWEVLKEFSRIIETKAASIENYFKKKDWRAYTIEVHSLKSTSRQIGAIELGEMAAALESAGNKGDLKTINAKTGPMLEKYRQYIPVLAPFFHEEKKVATGGVADDKELLELFAKLKEAADNLDSDEMEEACGEIANFEFSGKEKEFCDSLAEAVSNIDVEATVDILEKWEKLRKEGKKKK